MKLDDITIKIPEEPSAKICYDGPWTIANPYTKLRLKYGLMGPWEGTSWSPPFDCYAQSRGPINILPNLADFTISILMNSRVNTKDIGSLAEWLKIKKNKALIIKIQTALLTTSNLHTAKDEAIKIVGKIIDKLLDDRADNGERVLKGISTAKIFKWLSAWAPQHIPMIDNVVHYALSRKEAKNREVKCYDLLNKFKFLLDDNYDTLLKLGHALGKDLSFHEDIAPVRILDSLIWFDWVCMTYPKRRKPFNNDIDFSRKKEGMYPARKAF